ncbi:MAG: acyl--CoA ligase [Pseudomonadota bacterium]
MAEILADLLAPHPAERAAINAPRRKPLSYGALRDLSNRVRDYLAVMGLGKDDRVAIVLPNGPEMAACFVAMAQAVTTAPLNPAYKEHEFAFYLKDLGAKAMVLVAGDDGPAAAAAQGLGIRVIRLELKEGGAAGDFTLLSTTSASSVEPEQSAHADTALILHTSGTTSRPKIVPLTQANLAVSAGHIAHSLALSPGDRCLNVMPLFHIHGLVAAVLATLSSGGEVVCTPGFDALKFFGWLREANPTWYTAVPTMHQAILARATRNAETIAAARLRFLRSSSASLPGPVMTELAATFGAPVIEGYGMTEAAHQMCSNPLPPAEQKPGAVGVPAGPEVRIAHETNNRLLGRRGAIGEVVISGPNVTPGYEGNPEANAKSFFEAEGKRWFRTGDQGSFDAEGYLTLTGRLKEIINRGGEKVSPLEVDGVLSEHPAVAQAVTFALPHAKLGEEVAAALVLKDGAKANANGIKKFARERLAGFKVPREILILDEIPKGATGKLQRIGLAEKLGLTGAAS